MLREDVFEGGEGELELYVLRVFGGLLGWGLELYERLAGV
jgi:hypothetical protein